MKILFHRSFRFLTSVVLFVFCVSIFPQDLWARSHASSNNKSQVSAGIFGVYSTSLSTSDLAKVSDSLHLSLVNTGHFKTLSQETMKNQLREKSKGSSQDPGAAQIDFKKLDDAIAQGRKLYYEVQFETAAAILRKALDSINRFDAPVGIAPKVSEAYLTLALVLEAQEKQEEAHNAFLNAIAFNPEKQIDISQYAPGFIEKFSKAKEEFASLHGSALKIESSPSGATLVLNDQEYGKTSFTIKNLKSGSYHLSVMKEGFEPIEKEILILADDKNNNDKLAFNLAAQEKVASYDALNFEILSQKKYADQISKLAEAGKEIGINEVFAARVEKQTDGYDLFLIRVDSTSGVETGKSYVKLLPDFANLDLSTKLAFENLFAGREVQSSTNLIAVWPDGKKLSKTQIADAGSKSDSKKKKSFFKSWPFYTILGVLVAGGGAGAALALSGSGGGSSNTGAVIITP